MKFTLLIIVGLISICLGKKSDDEEKQSVSLPAPTPNGFQPTEVKKWSIKELFSSDMSEKKRIIQIIKVLKLVGFIGVPALKALVDAKLRKNEKKSWQKNMGKDSWHAEIGNDCLHNDCWYPSIRKDIWNDYEYAAGYDMYGNHGDWPVGKKHASKFGSLFANKFSTPIALKHKLTKGKFR